MAVGFVNEPDDYVVDAAQGLVLSHPSVAMNSSPLFLHRAKKTSGKVALVSGGGTGHEPLHASFIGEGMLDAAVPGAIFSSPTARQVVEATRAVATERGVLHIVKNYTGDLLNFSIAAEICADDGVEVQRVVVDDDLATDLPGSKVGRRGTGATLTVEKICGALAEQGADLATIRRQGEAVAESSRSMALCLDACTHPLSGKKSFELAEGEVEFGVGIHGERGRAKIAHGSSRELVAELLRPLVEALALSRGDGVLALINGLGGTHLTEQYIVARDAHQYLEACGVTVCRTLTGPYVTALDMSGVSITLTKATKDMVALWDAPVRTPGLTW